ncbi:MAG: hypothetical protein V3V96_07395 [Acidiferrobacterales bacterium]
MKILRWGQVHGRDYEERYPGTFKNVNLMPECHVLKHQIASLAKRGYDLSEYKPEIRFHHAAAWFFILKKSSEFNADEYLVGTGLLVTKLTK